MKAHTAMLPRLSVMMFLQYFITGSWMVTMGLVLSEQGLSSIIGTAYSVGGIATILSPIFIGMLADRFFPSEKIMGVLHIISGVTLWMVPSQIQAGNGAMILVLIFLHKLLYQPTGAISNNIVFNSVLDKEEKYFPIIRVFGTIGFITVGLFIGQMGLSTSTMTFQIAAITSFILGIYSFTLPNTPAPAKGKPFSIRDLLFLDAFALLKDRNYFVFMICTMALFIVNTFYSTFASVFFNAVGFDNVASIMTIGQMSEVIFMLLMPLFFKRFGVKYMLLFGMLGFILRALLLGFGAPDVVFMIMAIALYGTCQDFIFVTGEIYTSQKADKKIKAQAQSLLKTFTWGIGMFIGSFIAGNIFNSTVATQEAESLSKWTVFWMYPAIVAGIMLIFFALFFKDKSRKSKQEHAVDESIASNH
ncbi:MFS transporter [Brevibacillus reuszeri]|uniref:MFS transporter n=1 Tax=Brevibacillus reuszeri TaxID=54915 RepID=UPI001B117AF4|nr:MFS transporter [Brevibacillus reuszeri]GIO08665.1 MFS transporter [Brevibacillus reuszeri]